MKKLVTITTLVAILCGTGYVLIPRSASAQNAPSESGPHKIALIDMAEVFKKYKKFEDLRETLKVEITAAEERVKKDIEVINTLKGQLKTMTEGSPQFKEKEKELATKAADMQANQQVQQRDFLRKESQIYKAVYGEVTEAVTKYAQYYNFTLVMRFKRDDMPESDNPQEVISRMNGTVIYHRPQDDITDAVLDYLNKRYGQSAGVVPTNGTAAPR